MRSLDGFNSVRGLLRAMPKALHATTGHRHVSWAWLVWFACWVGALWYADRERRRGYLLGLQHVEEELIRGNDPREVIKMLREE